MGTDGGSIRRPEWYVLLLRRGKGSPALGVYLPASASDNRMPNSSGDFITSCGFLGLAGRGFRNFFLEKNAKR